MLQQLLTIGRNTFLESIRQPIFTVLLIVASLALVLNPQLAAYTLEDDNKLMIDMGLSTLLFTGLLLAAFTAAGVLSAELENRTVLTVVSKPVARPLFVAGKFLGVAGALGVALWILGIVFVLTVRHRVMQTASDKADLPVILFGLLAWFSAAGGAALGNYFYRWVFTSSFVTCLAILESAALALVLLISRDWHFQPLWTEFVGEGALADGQLPLVMLLVFESVLVIAAAAIAASTRLGQLMTLLICAGLFSLGLVSETNLAPLVHERSLAETAGLLELALLLLGRAVYLVLPNFQFLWLADALAQGLSVPVGHVALLSAYAGLQIAALLALAVALFQTREVG